MANIKDKFNRAKKYLLETPGVEILHDGIDLLHQGPGSLRRGIQKTKPKKFVRETIKPKSKKVEIPAIATLRVAKAAGVTIAGSAQFLLWIAARLLDNPIPQKSVIALSKMQIGKNKKGKDKKFSSFVKRNPNISAYFVYWAMLFAAGTGVYKNYDSIRDEIVKEWSNTDDKENMSQDDMDIIKKPGAEWCEMEYVNALCVAVPLVFEECFTTAELTSERGGIYNIGYCMTSMPVDKNNPYGKWRKVQKNDVCTQNQAALWASVYNQKYIFPIIAEKLKVRVSMGMILALADLSYNSGALGIMLARLNDGWSEKEILDKMLEYRKAKINGKLVVLDGLVVRRWWDYMNGSNVCDYNKLLDCKLTAVSQIGSDNLYSDRKKYNPIITETVVDKVLQADVPTKPTVREIFNKSETGKGYIKSIEDRNKEQHKIDIKTIDQDSGFSDINEIAFAAQSAFDKNDFKTAEVNFRKMIELVPDAYDSYNDLIYTLYMLGKYDEGLKYARILIDLGHENDVDEDKIFGSAYFNAGLCREAKGDLIAARKNYVTASLRMPNNQKVKDAIKNIDGKMQKISAKDTVNNKSKFDNGAAKTKEVAAKKKAIPTKKTNIKKR